jgi:hypothetical protein
MIEETMETKPRRKTYNAGACEERKQIIDHIHVMLSKIRATANKPTADDALVDLRGWIRSRTERTRARKGGL